MHLFRSGARLSEAKVEEIRQQVRVIHDALAKKQTHGAALQDYFVERDYWPLEHPALDDGDSFPLP
ncbi:MAG TPA: hypothetical protein VFY10_08750 [Dehalococcoidia bacterium]|jgi:hypothetical protein|nr:hypothetical protein [Dehalococcoidia bacterium]